jgi:predicted DCC family thiol-disulfide oxidoreductase YuxK
VCRTSEAFQIHIDARRAKVSFPRSILNSSHDCEEAMKTLTQARHEVIRGLRADEIFNDARGWTINLAIFRIVILSFGVLPWALLFLKWTEKILPGISPEMWVPVSFFRLLPAGFLSNVGVARGLAVADIVLVILGIIGFWTRSSIGLATLVSLYGFGLMQNLGKVNHESCHLIWFMSLLAAGPSGHFLSIDALKRAIKNADDGTVELCSPSAAALWTLRYTWLLMGALYFVPGIAKLQSVLTAHWAGTANIRNILWTKWLQMYWYDPHFVRPIRVDLLPGWILVLLGTSVVAFEIGFILLVLSRRVRPALGLWGLAFHIGNGLVLHIWFTGLMWAYVSLFDWTAIGRAISSRDPLIVLYDGGCKLCRRTVAILRSFDLFDALRPAAGLLDEPSRNAYPQITNAMLTRDLYAAAGSRFAAGYDAYVWIAKRLLLLWPIAPVMRFSPVEVWGRKVYQGIVGSRHCEVATPELKPPAPTRPPKFTGVYWLGTAMLMCQLGISSVMLLYRLRPVHSPPETRWLKTVWWRVDGIGKRGPFWPFDLYPTFTPATPPDIKIWEARWVTSNGREIRVSPTSYDHAFGNAPLTMTITTGMLAEQESERGQARSLHLVRLLWRNEVPEIRRSATAVNIYSAEYKIRPPNNAPFVPLRESLLHTFPLVLFSKEGPSPSVSTSPQRLQ